jgi:hypothetical protein
MHQAVAISSPAPDAQAAVQVPPPSPAPAPAPAPAPGPAAQLPGVPTTLQFPTTARELQGLKQRRQILREQRDMATNRRSGLVEELRSSRTDEIGQQGREALQNRLRVVDEQILQIERDITTTESLMSGASPEVLAESRAQDNRNVNTGYDDDDVAGMSAAFFGLGVILTMIVGRLRRRRARKFAAATASATGVTATDPNIQRLNAAVDAIAEEVERIGEGQRFVTQLLSTRQDVRVLTNEQR